MPQMALPLGRRPAVGKTRRARRSGRIRGLRVVRVEGDAVCDQHCDASTAARTPSSSFWLLRDRLPYRRALNTVMISSASFAKSSSNVAYSPWLRITTSTPLASQRANSSSAPKRSRRSLCVMASRALPDLRSRRPATARGPSCGSSSRSRDRRQPRTSSPSGHSSVRAPASAVPDHPYWS